eukprot:7814475-Karenia_brevis.AAC.1
MLLEQDIMPTRQVDELHEFDRSTFDRDDVAQFAELSIEDTHRRELKKSAEVLEVEEIRKTTTTTTIDSAK